MYIIYITIQFVETNQISWFDVFKAPVISTFGVLTRKPYAVRTGVKTEAVLARGDISSSTLSY